MDQTSRRQYWQIYKTKKKQVSLTLTLPEYRYWQRLANGNGVTIGRQIKAEATAYQRQERVPDRELEKHLAKQTHVLRGIANNLNQIAHHSNIFCKWLERRQTFHLLINMDFSAQNRVFRHLLPSPVQNV